MNDCDDCRRLTNGDCGKHGQGSEVTYATDVWPRDPLVEEIAKLLAKVERLEKLDLPDLKMERDAARMERDAALLQNSELTAALLDASRLLTLFVLNDLKPEDVKAFLPRVEALVVDKRPEVTHLNPTRCADCGASLTDGHTH